MERDQIAGYLDQLRSSLLTSRRRAQLILDEAEDHLRESAAAVLANIVLAAWKLAAVYLLAVFATGLVWHLLAGSMDGGHCAA
jgi:hypothetical protein